MKKVGALSFEQIVLAIIVLIVLGLGGTLTKSLSSKPVQYLLGRGDISEFDKDIIERFNRTQEMNAEAIDSVNGLLYSVNRLADHHTHNLKTEDYAKEFGAVTVSPTYVDARTIIPSGSKEQIARIIVKNILNCDLIFSDKGYENTRCFSIDTSKFAEVKITEEDIAHEFEVYEKDEECDEKCKEKVKDMGGKGWFNFDNWGWDDDLVLESGISNVHLCGDNAGVNEIHITTDLEGNCEVEETGKVFGLVVENFNFPQEISKDGNFITKPIEAWLNAYGDPQYILYYEVFPKGEEEFWKASSYNIAVGTILTVEGVFLLFDAATFGVGKFFRWAKPTLEKPIETLLKNTVRPIIEGIKGGARRITPQFILDLSGRIMDGLRGIFDALAQAGRALSERAASPFRAIMFREAQKDMAEDMLEASSKEAAERALKTVLKNEFKSLNTETIEEITTLFLQAFRTAKDNFPNEDFVKNGLSRQAIQSIDDSLSESLQGIVQIGGIGNARALAISLRSSMQDTLQEASLRTVPRVFLHNFRAAARASSKLRAAVTGDVTREERQIIIQRIVKEGTDVLDNMDQRQAARFLTHTDTRKMVDKIFKEGDIRWDIGEVPFTREQKEAATEAFDQAVDGLDIAARVRHSETIQRGFSKTVQWLNPIQKKRHLVALTAAVAAMRAESIQAKFTSSGTNAFGLKIPYAPPVDYDELSHIQTPKQKEEFFENYGDPGYQGMLPEANRYWMSLIRDASWWWTHQDPARFHLVSPCKADVFVRVSTCTCVGKTQEDTIGTSSTWIGSLFEDQGVYKTGEASPQLQQKYPEIYPNGKVEHFDGGNPSFFTLDENGYPLKQCNPSGEWFTFGEEEYSVECMTFNPVIDENLDQNYCYHGLSPIMSIANGALNYALPIGAGIGGAIACTPVGLPHLCGIAGGAIGGLAGSLSYALLSIDHQWPNHS